MSGYSNVYRLDRNDKGGGIMLFVKDNLTWNLSKGDTYGTEVFVRFRKVSALGRFELKSSQI